MNSRITAIIDRCKKYSNGELPKEDLCRSCLSIDGWQIDEKRFTYFLESVPNESKPLFLERFKYKVNIRRVRPVDAFDELINARKIWSN